MHICRIPLICRVTPLDGIRPFFVWLKTREAICRVWWQQARLYDGSAEAKCQLWQQIYPPQWVQQRRGRVSNKLETSVHRKLSHSLLKCCQHGHTKEKDHPLCSWQVENAWQNKGQRTETKTCCRDGDFDENTREDRSKWSRNSWHHYHHPRQVTKTKTNQQKRGCWVGPWLVVFGS